MSIRLRIERIVLDGYGFGPRERRLFENSLTTELTRMLAAGDVAGGSSVTTAGAMAPALDPYLGTEPAAVGAAVARSVHAGIPR